MPLEPRTALLAAGVLHLGWAVFHMAFPRLFRWGDALSALDSVNRGILRVLNLCLTFQFLLAAWLLLDHTDEVAATPLGRALCLGLAAFWAFRLVLQSTHFRALSARSLVLSALFAATALACGAPLLVPLP